MDAVPPGQLLARKRRPEVVPIRLLQQLDGSRLGLLVDPPVRRPAPQTMHDNAVAIGLQRTSSLRTQRSLTSIFSAACRCVTTPSRALFSHSSQSRSSWFIAIRSILPVFNCQEELSTLPY
jgi:hypothetical protein